MRSLGLALVGLEQRSDARSTFAELLELSTRHGHAPTLDLTAALAGIALAAERKDAGARRLHGAVRNLRHTTKLGSDPMLGAIERHLEQPLGRRAPQQTSEQEQAAGAAMTLEETIELAQSLADAQPGTTADQAQSLGD